uniref:Uncharacterized protein n=1 Tax=Romanomermis culicivorax TaxID=13658 RepID=A0A915J8S4_ROMCU
MFYGQDPAKVGMRIKALSYFAMRYRAVPVVLFILTGGAMRCPVVLRGGLSYFAVRYRVAP